MALKITHRVAADVPPPGAKADSAEFTQMTAAVAKRQPGMALEIDTGDRYAEASTSGRCVHCNSTTAMACIVCAHHVCSRCYLAHEEAFPHRGYTP